MEKGRERKERKNGAHSKNEITCKQEREQM